ncbi:MAG: leucine-rich repeat domain-containing protein [Alphaproteobacteria bacterium]|nr:leucine-rich repeat domain-containing protein [Alphaproteobacteria bacterium]
MNKVSSVPGLLIPGAYEGWQYMAKTPEAEANLKAYIKKIMASENPHAIPESENFDKISHSAFEGIEYLVVPAYITDIGGCAFAKLEDLKTLIIKGKNVRLGGDCLNGSVVKKFEAPGIVEVGDFCFWECHELEDLCLPSLQVGGTRSVGRCPKLKSFSAPRLHKFDKLIYDCNNLEKANIGGDNGYEYDNGAEKNKFDIATIQQCPNLKTLIVSTKANRMFGRYFGPMLLQKELRETLPSDMVVNFGSGKHKAPERYKLTELVPVAAPAKESVIEVGKTHPLEFNENGWIGTCRTEETRNRILELAKSGATELPVGNIAAEMSLFPDLMELYLPESVKELGAFSLAQCYTLKNLYGLDTKKIGDHALYCDTAMKTLYMPNVELVDRDALNGTGEKGMDINLLKAKEIRSRALWQTGAEVLYLPALEKIEPNGIEENFHLKTLEMPNARKIAPLAVCSNPLLKPEGITLPHGFKPHRLAFYRNGQAGR